MSRGLPRACSGTEFVAEMTATVWQLLDVRDAALAHLKEAVQRADMKQLLRGALRAELEASEIAALWVPVTPELEARIAFARQCGDEARHYTLIERRLHELGGIAGVREAPSKLFRYLAGLGTTVERVAAAQFTREAVGYKANELFIAFCEQAGDHATARLYREEIQPDEKRHHEWGQNLLAELAQEPHAQAIARQAILTTLSLADELRSLAAGRMLVETVPGC